MLDLLIKNGLIIDGTGNPGYYASIGVEGDTVRILRGNVSSVEAAQTIDATGHVVCPGFIDLPSPAGLGGRCAAPHTGGEPLPSAQAFQFPYGIALSPDEQVLDVSDTTGGHSRAFDLAPDGSLSNGRVHCEVRIPDGMAVDVDGRIWSSSSRGIVVFDVDGATLGKVEFRGTPTNCAFGGAEAKTLRITARKMVYKVEWTRPEPPAGRDE